jgi:hypothetical protein
MSPVSSARSLARNSVKAWAKGHMPAYRARRSLAVAPFRSPQGARSSLDGVPGPRRR